MADKDDVASRGGGQRIKDPTINAMRQQLKVFLREIRDWIDSQGKRIASSQIARLTYFKMILRNPFADTFQTARKPEYALRRHQFEYEIFGEM
ncbi:uncharacterized protein G2W53_005844 [Senna tora]|uniref:Uncharacterized protein n=1 Tax=Senna tora TaxID=362788 RepID=A0A835CFX5_9FABA|nr:uncharacterized protein G2W53_005844 [Senna tora]